MNSNYRKEQKARNEEMLKAILKKLPHYASEFINAKNFYLSTLTRLGYARDLELFFKWLVAVNPVLKNSSPSTVPIDVLGSLKPQDINEYMAYIGSYEINGRLYTNNSAGKRRKLASVRELYKYLCKYGSIRQNPAVLVDTPKDEYKKEIRALDKDEKRLILSSIDNKKNKSNNKAIRDRAIITVFLGTGIRVSELVGLNLDDVNMKQSVLSVIAKGGKYSHHFFNNEVWNALDEYLEIRGNFHPADGEEALFLSKLGKRLGVRSVELMVEGYSSTAFGSKNNAISPHKLRSTYGTDLYAMTGDIALVSDNLGHADISTTKRYYAKQNIDNLRKNKDFKIFE